MKRSVLVVGGGIAGMRAGLELLLQGFELCLLTMGDTFGEDLERMEQVFPSGEYAACAIQPLVQELTSNPNATILTSTQLLSLQGSPGDFKVDVSREASQVQLSIGAVIVAVESEMERRSLLDRLGLGVDEEQSGGTHSHPHPCRTPRAGVFLCGAGPREQELDRLVVQACAAAAQVAALLVPAGQSKVETRTEKQPGPTETTGEPKIAVLIDGEEQEISEAIDLDEICAYTRSLPNVEYVEVSPSLYDGTTISEVLEMGKCNRLVVAGPSPIEHEFLFQQHAESAGLNRYLLEMVNLKFHCASVHSADRRAATEKAKMLMKMGVARVRLLEALGELIVPITQRCLIVGGTAAGVACAVPLAQMGVPVELIEKHDDLSRVPGNDDPDVMPLAERCLADENIQVHGQTLLGSVEGRMGKFAVQLISGNETTCVEVGVIVMATMLGVDGAGSEEALALTRNEDGFYASTEGALNLLDCDTAGVFICGPARADLTIQDTLLEGEAAASRAAGIVAADRLKRLPTISRVVDDNCDGCAYCVDPCPTRSITLLEYMLGGDIKKVVEVSERTCIGCGICMSTCPKQGIDVRHYTLRTFSETVQAALENDSDEPLIVCFCCNRCAYPGADAAGRAGLQYPTSVRIIRTVCSGTIHPNIIMDALTQGTDGVLLCGCHLGNCRSRAGIRKALDRKEAIELMLEDFGLEPERFRLEHIAASEGRKFAEVVKDMTEQLSSLGPSPYR